MVHDCPGAKVPLAGQVPTGFPVGETAPGKAAGPGLAKNENSPPTLPPRLVASAAPALVTLNACEYATPRVP